MEISRFLTPKWEGSGMPAARQLEWVEGVCVNFFFFGCVHRVLLFLKPSPLPRCLLLWESHR